jgi:hypothetical protein
MKIIVIITIILMAHFLLKASRLREEMWSFEPLYYACKIDHSKTSLIFLAV